MQVHLLSKEEVDAIIPTRYEIENSTTYQLTQSLITNTYDYQNDQSELSTGLRRALQTWLFMMRDDRLEKIASLSDHAIDNVWKIIGYFFNSPGSAPPPDLFDKLEIVGSDDPTLNEITNIIRILITTDGTPEELIEKFEAIIENHNFLQTNCLEVFGLAFIMIGPLNNHPQNAIKPVETLIQYTKQLNTTFFYINMRNIMGLLKMNLGNYTEAIEIFDEVIAYTDTNQFRLLRLSAVNNRGMSLYSTSRWEEALQVFQELVENDPENSIFLNNLSDVHSRMGNMEKAWEYGKKFLENTSNPFAGAYEFLQPILHELGLDEEQEKLLELVRKRYEEFSIPISKAYLLLMEARYARYALNLGSALNFINEGIDMSIKWKNINLMYRLLIERIYIFLDLYDLKSTTTNRQRLFNAVDTLIQLSDEQGVSIGSIEGLRLRSDIYLQFNEMTAAKEDLYNAAKLAKEFNHMNLYEEISSELDKLRGEDLTSEKEDEKSIFASIKAKLRQIVGVGGGSTKFEEQEYTTHGSIIMSNTGLPIYSNYLTDKLQTDSALISGLISAVSSMLNEAAQSKGFLKTIQREDFSLLFEPVKDYLVISIVSKDNFEARQKLQKFTNQTSKVIDKYGFSEMTSNIPLDFEKDIDQAVQTILI